MFILLSSGVYCVMFILSTTTVYLSTCVMLILSSGVYCVMFILSIVCVYCVMFILSILV